MGKRLHNLPRLREIGFQANRRLLEVEKISHDCILAEEAFQQINRPRQVATQRASALRFADPIVQSLWNALLLFPLLPTGFSNRELREHLAPLLGQLPEQLTPGRMTYQLRRLRLHGMIQRIPKTHRYRVTEYGLRAALFFTRTYNRILRPGLAQVLPSLPAMTGSLRRTFNQLLREVDACVTTAQLAA